MEIKGLEERVLRVRSPLLMSYGKEGVGWSGQCQCWREVDIAKNHYLILSYREAQGLQKLCTWQNGLDLQERCENNDHTTLIRKYPSSVGCIHSTFFQAHSQTSSNIDSLCHSLRKSSPSDMPGSWTQLRATTSPPSPASKRIM